MKLVLVRHGRPMAATNPSVNAVGFARWVRAYRHSGLHPEDFPEDELQVHLKGAYVFSSHLLRAVESGERCLQRPPDQVSKVFREFDISRFKLPGVFPVNVWLLISRLAWLLGFSAKSEPFAAAKIRVIDAADILEEKAAVQVSVLFGHGLFNRFLAKELKQRGWQAKKIGKGYWSVIELTKVAPQ